MQSTCTANLRGCKSYRTGTYTTVQNNRPIVATGTEDPDELFFTNHILVFLQFTSAPFPSNGFAPPLVNLDAVKLIF
jgi:hypothetical protein